MTDAGLDRAATDAGLDRAALAPLWTALRARFEASAGPVARVRVGPLDQEAQTALADLLGLARLPGEQAVVSVAGLDAALAPLGVDARAAVEAVGGPLADRAAQRLAARAERAALWDWLDGHPQVRAEPGLAPWAAAMRAAGVVGGSVSRTRALFEQALAVLAALPADGRPLPAFADAVAGDPHALDDGTRLSTVVLRALATLRDEPVPADAEQRRAAWDRVGVACDALSTAVLVAGLRPAGGGVLSGVLRTWADAGQATIVTLAQLRAAARLAVGDGLVTVVENPSILAEALRRFGADCPPLVCTAGWPNSAAITLLRHVTAGGASLRYHGDFDGDGLRIAAHVADRTGAAVWRMSAADYLAAVRPTGPPVGRVTDAPWDAALAGALRARGVALPQEAVAAALLDACAAPRS